MAHVQRSQSVDGAGRGAPGPAPLARGPGGIVRVPARLAMLSLLGALPGGPLASQGAYWENGLSVSSGRYYFSERTTTWTLTTGAAFQRGALTLRATLPAYLQNTTLLTSGLAGPLPTGGGGPASGALQDSSNARKARHSGGGAGPMLARMMSGGAVEVPASSVTGYTVRLGDPTAQLSLWPQRSSSTALGFTATVKVPATNDGTGAWDVGGSVGIAQTVGGRLLLMLDAGYWHLGDLPELDLQDPWLGSASAGVMLGGGWACSLSGSAARSVVAGFDDSYGVGAGVTHVGRTGSVGVTAMVGLTESTADFTIGVSWRQALGTR